jgi:hypothetical protein
MTSALSDFSIPNIYGPHLTLKNIVNQDTGTFQVTPIKYNLPNIEESRECSSQYREYTYSENLC